MANHPREAPPPSRWGKSKNGTYFYLVHTKDRTDKGEKLYRCRYATRVTGRHWTLAELNDNGVRWLKRRPSSFDARLET